MDGSQAAADAIWIDRNPTVDEKVEYNSTTRAKWLHARVTDVDLERRRAKLDVKEGVWVPLSSIRPREIAHASRSVGDAASESPQAVARARSTSRIEWKPQSPRLAQVVATTACPIPWFQAENIYSRRRS